MLTFAHKMPMQTSKLASNAMIGSKICRNLLAANQNTKRAVETSRNFFPSNQTFLSFHNL